MHHCSADVEPVCHSPNVEPVAVKVQYGYDTPVVGLVHQHQGMPVTCPAANVPPLVKQLMSASCSEDWMCHPSNALYTTLEYSPPCRAATLSAARQRSSSKLQDLRCTVIVISRVFGMLGPPALLACVSIGWIIIVYGGCEMASGSSACLIVDYISSRPAGQKLLKVRWLTAIGGLRRRAQSGQADGRHPVRVMTTACHACGTSCL